MGGAKYLVLARQGSTRTTASACSFAYPASASASDASVTSRKLWETEFSVKTYTAVWLASYL